MSVTIYTPSAPCVKGQAYSFVIGLLDQSDVKLFKDSPTMEAVDFTLIGDGEKIDNLTDLPAAITGVTRAVLVSLTAAETAYDSWSIVCHDENDAEWCDLIIFKETMVADVLPDVAEIADAVLDEALSGHTTSGTPGGALNKIGTGQISVVSPVKITGDVETTQGDDYKAADGRALEWTNQDGTWIDLTDATAVAVIDGVMELSVSVVVPTGAGQKVMCEPTAALTALITAKPHAFQVIATQPAGLGGETETLVRGIWTSEKRLTAPTS